MNWFDNQIVKAMLNKGLLYLAGLLVAHGALKANGVQSFVENGIAFIGMIINLYFTYQASKAHQNSKEVVATIQSSHPDVVANAKATVEQKTPDGL